MHKLVSLKLIDPNPYRHMDRYPVDDNKIQELILSMDRTGFWDNVIARKVGERYQLAYGHHRWISFKRKYGKDASMNLILKDISDEDMLRIMADENMTEWSSNAVVEQETIRAVIQAYADGKIELERPKTKGTGVKGFRIAPNFSCVIFNDIKNKSDAKVYNAESIARFLGWMSGNQVSPRVRNALAALEAIEEGLIAAEDMAGLSSRQAESIAVEAKAIERSYRTASSQKSGTAKEEMVSKGKKAAREAAKTAITKIKDVEKPRKAGEKHGWIGVTEEMKRHRMRSEKEPPMVEEFCQKLVKDIDSFIGTNDDRMTKLEEVAKVKDNVNPLVLKSLVVSLTRLSERCLLAKAKLQGKSNLKIAK